MNRLAILRRSPKGGGGSSSSSPSPFPGSSGGSYSSPSSYKGSGSGSSSYNNGGTTVIYTGGGSSSSYHSGSSGVNLPWWAWALIIWAVLALMLFFSALVYYCCKERKRKAQGKDQRMGHALWKAFCVASGLWFWIWAYKRCCGKKRKSAGTYTKIEEGHSSNNSTWYGAPPGPVSAPYAQGGAGYASPAGATRLGYEPVRYSGADAGAAGPSIGDNKMSAFTNPIITGPLQQTSAIPLPTPSPSPAPSMVSSMTSPPPYSRASPSSEGIGHPPVVQAPYVQAPPPVSHTAPQAIPATYAPNAYPSYSGPGAY